MDHVRLISFDSSKRGWNSEEIVRKVTGRYYTHEEVCRRLSLSLVKRSAHATFMTRELHIIDPFCGDGRLVQAFLQELSKIGEVPPIVVHLWDVDQNAVDAAVERISLIRHTGVTRIESYCGDSFARAASMAQRMDVVLTNPPWEILKPDPRDLGSLDDALRVEYVAAMKAFDRKLEKAYPDAQPARKYAGWGTNLSRVGIDACLSLLKSDGIAGIVAPASFFADDQSQKLRTKIFTVNDVHEIEFLPANARLYGSADVDSCFFTLSRKLPSSSSVCIIRRNSAKLEIEEEGTFCTTSREFRQRGSAINLTVSQSAQAALAALQSFPRLKQLEEDNVVWAGRELDETGLAARLSERASVPVVKGRMIERYGSIPRPALCVDMDKMPVSVQAPRIVWRDVARSSRKRRMIATVIPPGWICGNSCNVLYVKSKDDDDLLYMLGIMNSMPFEFQLRTFLSTGHISLSAVRKIGFPHLPKGHHLRSELVDHVRRALEGDCCSANVTEAIAAKVYGLNEKDITRICTLFEDVTVEDERSILDAFAAINIDDVDTLRRKQLVLPV